MLREVITVGLKPSAMEANLRRQQKSVHLLICSVLMLAPVGVLVLSVRNTDRIRAKL